VQCHDIRTIPLSITYLQYKQSHHTEIDDCSTMISDGLPLSTSQPELYLQLRLQEFIELFYRDQPPNRSIDEALAFSQNYFSPLMCRPNISDEILQEIELTLSMLMFSSRSSENSSCHSTPLILPPELLKRMKLSRRKHLADTVNATFLASLGAGSCESKLTQG
jgi:CTLH/CRA C-terminal to LisH motif domain